MLRLGLIFLALGLASILVFNLFVTQLDDWGYLKEAVYLVPIGYILGFIGFVLIAIVYARRIKHRVDDYKKTHPK